jgi:hypothetical protein
LGKTANFWIDKLKHEDPSYRLLAVRALGNIGPEAKHAVPKLLAGHKRTIWIGDGFEGGDQSFLPAFAVASALRKIDPTNCEQIIATQVRGYIFPADVEKYKVQEKEESQFQDGAARIAAHATLATIRAIGHEHWERKKEISIGALLNALENGDEEIRQETMAFVYGMRHGREWKEMLPPIAKTLSTSANADYRKLALHISQTLTPDVRALVPVLVGRLGDKASLVRAAAVDILAELGHDGKDSLPKLRTLLVDDDPSVRRPG